MSDSSHPVPLTLPERPAAFPFKGTAREDQIEAPVKEDKAEAPTACPKVSGVISDLRVVSGPLHNAAQLGIFDMGPLRGILDLETAFQYLPLQEGRFRLLTIVLPGDYPVCTVEEYALDDTPPYAAMSYAWGLPTKTRAIFCKNPRSDLASFSISEHVLEALNSLFGYAKQNLKIWIDAICIDQDNPTEKAHQIAAMPRIYSQAEQVLCWLGAEANNSDIVIDSLPAIGEWVINSLGTKISSLGDGSDDSLLIKPNIELLVETAIFFHRPWFHRLWVLQEMLLARELVLVCGKKIVSWDVLFTAASQLCGIDISGGDISRTHFKSAVNGIDELGNLRLEANDNLINGLSQPELIRIMIWSRTRQVTEPVDRVWALMGLARPELRDSVSSLINYSQSSRTNFLATYKGFTKTFLLQDEHLWILSLIALTPRDQGLPSWCPNFCYDPNDYDVPLLQRTDDEFKLFNAGYSDAEPLKPRLRFLLANDQLAVFGFVIDRVRMTRTLRALPGQQLDDRDVLFFDDCCLEIADTVPDTPEKIIAAHSRTVIANRINFLIRPEEQASDKDVATWYAQWRIHLACDPRVTSMTVEEKKRICTYGALTKIFTRRTYMVTSNGRLGLAPVGTKAGDLVCILYGANTPYIVRSNGNGNPMTLVGDAYVDGIMYGEALSMPERRSGQEFVFY
jgi:hypothetical protein